MKCHVPYNNGQTHLKQKHKKLQKKKTSKLLNSNSNSKFSFQKWRITLEIVSSDLTRPNPFIGQDFDITDA